jgi:hypothetical protein
MRGLFFIERCRDSWRDDSMTSRIAAGGGPKTANENMI